MTFNKRRYVQQQIWDGSPFALYTGVAAFSLAVSCMFLTVGFLTGPSFLLYTPLIAAGLLLIGGFNEPHPIPRAWAWGLAWLVIAITGLFGVIGAADGGRGTAVFLCLGLLLLPTLGIGYSIWQAMQGYRAAIAASHDQMLLDLVELRHDLSFDEVDEELGIGKTAVLHRAETLHEAGRLTGAVDPNNERLYSLTGLAQKQNQIGSFIQAQGQIRFHDLSREMKVPEQLLRDWLYQMVRLGHFSGYVDWENDTVYSRQRDELLQQQTCPNCAAELKIAGQGIIGCEFCQAEIFV